MKKYQLNKMNSSILATNTGKKIVFKNVKFKFIYICAN